MLQYQYGNCPTKMKNILLKNSVRFGHFQFYAGQFDGLNQTLTVSGLEKSNKHFQPNSGSGQSPQSDLDSQ
jgi:hypothetical protein